ncbi:hypothetical protein C487_18015 [Natrinema pallidum DSM 3751]|uniref:Uncharacterized protein n=1 Tax=Natrinema pallidum DSM 3751 TaxID=1227495 RepID=L9YG94_9EURY|nr:hypothetical protein C487_18015 [Natrinema pallidum DSM 3751]
MPTRVVQQHHPDDINYSREDVSTDPDAFEDELRDPTADVKVMDYSLPDGDVRVFYTLGVSGTADDLDREISPAQLEEDLEPMDPTSRVIAIWLLQFFAEMQQEEQENGSELAIYKDLEIERVPEAVDHVSWDGSATDVAGSLMSNLILRHSLPNANHRRGSRWHRPISRRQGPSLKPRKRTPKSTNGVSGSTLISSNQSGC